ncbi:MAG: quinol:cytochrome C oxidoreductase [Flavobacteriaceae bacterium]|nr:quinol:cytochrome C oxidoreductase [Flavobacteriaceae bacterium]|tara:strand:- start:3841 stop:6918 length:3078 start_codon:yes stop_codon:yes gene_type:complete
MSSNKIYWKNNDQLDPSNPMIQKLEQNEFSEKLPLDFNNNDLNIKNDSTSRRDFLKYAGFSTAAAALAGCEGPVIKSVPYVVQPEQIRPGIANYYATAIADGYDFASVLVKTREGRPIKIKNNPDARVLGSPNGRVQASVLSLYDSMRLQGPKLNQSKISWTEFMEGIKDKINKLLDENKSLVILTQTFASPTTQELIDKLKDKYSNIKHVIYDTISESSSLDAFENAYGFRALADYDFSKAETIISLDADILGDWQGGGYDVGYSSTRIPKKDNGEKFKMSYHMQFEANMTLSGANADKRIPASPAVVKKILAFIYAELTNYSIDVELEPKIHQAASLAIKMIRSSKSKAVIVSGIQDVSVQELVLAINSLIKSEAFDPKNPKLIRQGNTKELLEVIDNLKQDKIGGLISVGVNPVNNLANGSGLAEAIKKLDFSATFSTKMNETASASQYVGALNHYLESWGDFEFKSGHFLIAQPTIRPLFDTLQFQDILINLLDEELDYYDYIKKYWISNILAGASFKKAIHDGGIILPSSKSFNEIKQLDLNEKAFKLAGSKHEGMNLILYSKAGMGDGQQANNPWLQEFPDPITRVSWDNYLTISKSDASNLGLKNINVANGALNGNYALISIGKNELKVPVLIQPGQAKGTVGLAFGYGKRLGLKEEMQVGVNAYELYFNQENVQQISIKPSIEFHEFACIQLHNTLMGRGDIVKETTLEIFNTKDKEYWNPVPKVSKNHIETEVTSPEVDMWQSFDSSIGHHFNLSIDLNSCTGCGACVIACHVENNVPVVGKEEIRKSRDMHWLRIDRYYSSEESFEADGKIKNDISGLGESLTTLSQMERASENPQVVFQPVMCQHCNHAPCETVCPVAATSHGRQGQNHMAYNRCVGTRYCANNCPYKVRRFNWFLYSNNDEFDYHMNDDLGRMVLNPDVVVRSRGVMEKCSFCIQMTQKTILDAKLEGREVSESEWSCACSDACATGAMVFGDVNDKNSKVSKLKENNRMYHLLESVGTKPNVMYQLKIRNKD